jgi:inosine-uridine nucleoside N-ribohydrolase
VWGNPADVRAAIVRTLAAGALAFVVATTILGLPASSASAAGTPVPVIVDTDMFGSVDDVGALAVAFVLQQKNEAKVIAIGVNKRADQSAVSTTAWKCAAAVAQFYNSGNVPIGTAMPNNGTATADIDFDGPCAAQASPSTPTPNSAVSVYRQALASQPAGSVVMVTTGYLGNMDALLESAPDAISPLSGSALIAAKVKMLVVMGGGYRSGLPTGRS